MCGLTYYYLLQYLQCTYDSTSTRTSEITLYYDVHFENRGSIYLSTLLNVFQVEKDMMENIRKMACKV